MIINRKIFFFLERLFSINCCWRFNFWCKRDNINIIISNNKSNNNINNNNKENSKMLKSVFVFCINGKV